MDSFLREIADILELDKVDPGDVLANFEDWDSLSVLSTIAMIDGMFHVNISAKEMNDSATPRALFELIQSKIKT